MARKKAKGPDARGYNQRTVAPKHNQHQPPPKRNTPSQGAKSYDVSKPRTYTLRLTEAMETQLRAFLGDFPLPKTTALPSDRFEKRLTNIYDRLIDLGFDFQDIQQAVLQLRYHTTLDLALDWLCWHVDALPPRFTDERFDDATNSSSVWVEPMTKPTTSAKNSSSLQNDATALVDLALLGTPHKKMHGEERNDEKDTFMSDAHKQWLLSQYQYEEEDEVTEADHDPHISIDDSSPRNILHDNDDLKQDRLKVKEFKAESEPLESQLNDEASCYMMSKHELKAMRSRVKYLKGQIKVLEEKIAGRERKTAHQSPMHELSVDDGNEEDNLLDIFSMSNENINLDVDKSLTLQVKQGARDEVTPAIPRDSVPKTWTGMKPKALLEDYCRRRKLPQPSFQRTTKTSCIMRMKGLTSEGEVEEIHQDGPTLADAQQFAATKALFQLDPKANIRHLLPPFHREVWSEWMRAALSTENKIKLDEGANRRNEISQLLRQLSEDDEMGRQKKVKNVEHGLDDRIDMQEQIDELWEDVKESKLSNPARLSQESIQLKNEFDTMLKSAEYRRHLELRERLPVYGFREAILEAINHNSVTIISAETGAGKTTQVPQFLLATALMQGKGGQTSIICTQPRRVAATSVAERVAEEIGERSVGGLIGYQIRMESAKSSRTKLLFCTTGVILRRLIEDPLLNGVSHVVVDEVHERQWQIDVLLISLRTLLQGRRPDLKVVLMSATLDSDLFSSYFWSAPVLCVPGRTFPVKNYFLEDLLEKTGHIIEQDSRYAQRSLAQMDTIDLRVTARGGRKRRDVAYLQSQKDIEASNEFVGYSMSTRRSMDRVDETILNYDLIEDVLKLLFHSNTFTRTDNAETRNGAVLIFLPGLREIRTLMDRLLGSTFFGKNDKIEVIPLHSSLSSKDQRRAFKPTRKGCRKIIISTNIAETSVTIPDITCVIDSGLVREVQRDQRTGTQKLVTTWCSKANTKQRCGRAGRVQPGISLRLFSSKTDSVMKSVTEPELKRIPLEEVCLTILASGLSTSCNSFLSNAPEPPLGSAVELALEDLRCIGAISIEVRDGNISDEPREALTALGEHLTRIPINARLGKMLLYGCMFQCLDPSLTLAACLSASQSPFVASISEGDEVKAAHSSFLDTSSDFVTLLNVWEAFVSAGSEARRFCREKFLNYNALLDIADARDQFLAHLCEIGFVNREVLDDGQGNYNTQSKSLDVIHFVICAGLYPNVAKVEPDLGLVHKSEKVVIHNSSVNAKALKERPSDWLAFHEKLNTGRQVTMSTTCFVHPFSLLLLGPMVHIDHFLREVEIDNWIKLTMSGKTAVMLKELKQRLERSLKTYIQQVKDENNVCAVKVIDQIISILCQV